MPTSPVLYVIGGLPGTGKSTLARSFAREMGAMWLRIDTLEQGLRRAGVIEVAGYGYELGYAMARDGLAQGTSVVGDAVNPISYTREAWRACALEVGCPCVAIEVVCSDRDEHRRRIETRAPDIDGLVLPSWPDVQQRAYEPWSGDVIRIDTAGRSPGACLAELLDHLGNLGPDLAQFGGKNEESPMDDASPGGKLQQQHARLMDLVNEVRAAKGTAGREAIAALADHLAAHFGSEESPTGWMAEAALKAPHRAPLIEDLQAEHGAMLAAARGLAAGYADDDAIEALLRTIEEHERREASVITEVLYEELGMGD